MRLIFTANGGSLAMPGAAEMARKVVKESTRNDSVINMVDAL